MTANDMLELMDSTLHNEPVLPEPETAKLIARYVNARSVAADMINTVLQRDVFNQADFNYWRGEHILTTKALAVLGIKVNTYSEGAQ